MIKIGDSEPHTGENDPEIKVLAAEACSAISQYFTQDWKTRYPFLVSDMLSDNSPEQHDRKLRNVALASLAAFKSKMPTGAPEGFPPFLDLNQDRTNFRPQARTINTQSRQASPHLEIPTSRPSQSPVNTSSPHASPDSTAGDGLAAGAVPHAVRRSTRAATVAAVRHSMLFFARMLT